jgi:lysyl-tRNA synthetase class 2
MLEFYTAYKDVNWMMDFCEEMLRTTIQTVIGSRVVNFGELQIDFGRPLERLTMAQAINKHLPDEWRQFGTVRVDETFINDSRQMRVLTKVMRHLPVSMSVSEGNIVEDGLLDKLWQNSVAEEEFLAEPDEIEVAKNTESIFGLVESSLKQPIFIHDFPKPISPLSKGSPENPAIAERFELYIMGMEVANGFSELNDPAEQLERLEEQTRQREGGDEEAMQADLDYVRALSYGMPPAAGIGIGVDRLTMLLTNRRSIRDVILFPHMRPQKAHAEEAGGGEGPQGSDARAGNP